MFKQFWNISAFMIKLYYLKYPKILISSKEVSYRDCSSRLLSAINIHCIMNENAGRRK